jgi:DNA-binding transcriptional LysR family regulator
VLILPQNHPLKEQPNIKIEEIASESFIMPKAGCQTLVKELFKEKKITPNINYEISDNHAIIAMVQENLGISIIPKMLVTDHQNGFHVVPIKGKVFRSIGLAVQSLQTVSPAVQSFIQEANEWTNKHLADNK